MVDTPLITMDSVASAQKSLIEQGRKPSQRSVIKLLGGGSFSQLGPLLRELEAEAGDVPGSALTEPLSTAVSEAVESLWRELGKEADRVVNEARQQFERELKAEQVAVLWQRVLLYAPRRRWRSRMPRWPHTINSWLKNERRRSR